MPFMPPINPTVLEMSTNCMLVQKGQYIKMHLFTSSFVYLCQDLHTSKTRFE